MYAFRFYAHKDGDGAESGTRKAKNLLEYLHRVQGVDSSDYDTRNEISRDVNSDPEFGPDLLSPFGYSNDAVRPQQAQLDTNTKTVADYMNKERRQSYADYSGKTADTVGMYCAPHRGISVLGINDPRYSIYDPTAMLSNSSLDTYISQEDLQKRAADLLIHNKSLQDNSSLHDLADFDGFRKRAQPKVLSTADELMSLYKNGIQGMEDKASKAGKNKYDEFFDTRYFMLPEHASKEKSPFYDVHAFLRALYDYADTTSNYRPDNDFAKSNLWLVKVDLDDMYSNDDRRKHFLHTGADDMHEFLAKKVTPYRYMDRSDDLQRKLHDFFVSKPSYGAHNLKEANEAAADFMHKNFKVDPDEVWSDANLKDVYYDCSEPIYQAFCTTKLKPSVLKGAKGHFE